MNTSMNIHDVTEVICRNIEDSPYGESRVLEISTRNGGLRLTLFSTKEGALGIVFGAHGRGELPRCPVCGDPETDGPHDMCRAAMPSDEELSSDGWRR